MLRLSETVGSLGNNKFELFQNNDSFPTQAVNPDQNFGMNSPWWLRFSQL